MTAGRRPRPPLRLLADIGGTHARFALQRRGGPPTRFAVLATRDHRDLASAARAYYARARPAVRPTEAAIAVASPVAGDRVRLTNREWSFSISEVRARLGLTELAVANDFAAIAMSIPHLRATERRKVGRGGAASGAPIAVLGPGTGLGVSALVPTPTGWVPVATEGGHATCPATDEREGEILRILRRRYGHVSAERVLSGPGLVNLYGALAELVGVRPLRLTPAAITRRAREGRCAICREALAVFSALLGTVAGDLALAYGARGGVYVAGGIVPKLGHAFDARGFRRRFEEKGRFRAYLAAVPTYVILHGAPAFLGLAALLDSKAASR